MKKLGNLIDLTKFSCPRVCISFYKSGNKIALLEKSNLFVLLRLPTKFVSINNRVYDD